jgi:putative chitinase
MDMVSPHFSMLECTHSDTAVERGIDNTPNVAVMANIASAATRLEAVRSYLAQPIRIDSWYRSPAVNAAVGGVSNSAHLQGWAIDFVCPAFGSPADIVKFLISTGIKFDQLIEEGAANGHTGWCHISFAPSMRQQTLTAHFVKGAPTTYSAGA